MATKSILKNVDIRDKKLGREFVNALENAYQTTDKEIVLSKPCTKMKQKDIRNLIV